MSAYLRQTLLVIAFAAVCLGVVLYWPQVMEGVSWVLRALRPITIGVVIAFFVNLPMRVIERRLLGGLDRIPRLGAAKRPLAMVLSLLFYIGVLALAVSLLYPQLRDSVQQLISSIPGYGETLSYWASLYFPELDLSAKIAQGYQQALDSLPQLVQEVAPHLFNFTTSFASGVTDTVLALVLSIYLLLSKDRLARQFKEVVNIYLPKQAGRILPIASLLNDRFRRFLGGQLTEAVILGTICFVGMSVLQLPYTPLVSTLIAITSVIPVFGALIGTIPSAFVILMANPVQALIFLIFIVVVQQVENNVIYPRVVGDSIGLGGLWVLLTVIVCGGLWGIPGIFVGIPVVAALHELMRLSLQERRKAQKAAAAK